MKTTDEKIMNATERKTLAVEQSTNGNNDVQNITAEPINTNIVNGSAEGSVRTVGSAEEIDGYVIGLNAFAEGYATQARGRRSHAEGDKTSSVGNSSHAEGDSTVAQGICSHAEGEQTIASGTNQHVQGRYNIEDTENKYAHIVGNGTSDNRSNAHTVDWDGNAWFNGGVIANGFSNAQNIRPGWIHMGNNTDSLNEICGITILQSNEEENSNINLGYGGIVSGQCNVNAWGYSQGNPTEITYDESTNTTSVRFDGGTYHLYYDSYLLLYCDGEINVLKVIDSDSYHYEALGQVVWNNNKQPDLSTIYGFIIIDDIKFYGSGSTVPNNLILGMDNIALCESSIIAGDCNKSTYRTHASRMFIFGEYNNYRGDYGVIIGRQNDCDRMNRSLVIGELHTPSLINNGLMVGKGLINTTNRRINGQFISGQYNEPGDYIQAVGFGQSDTDRKNIYTLDTEGNGVFAGKVTAGADPIENMDLTTKQYVDNAIAEAIANLTKKLDTK